MNRRNFMAMTGAAGVGALSELGGAMAATAGAGRVYLELQKYTLEGAAYSQI